VLRRLIIFLLVIIAVFLVAANFVALHVAEKAVATRLDLSQPGAHVSVSISGEPFLWYLVDKGEVKTVDVSSATYGDVEQLRVHVTDLVLDRHQLLHGNLEAKSLQDLTVDATVNQATVDQQAGLPLTLGNGTIGYKGLQLPVTASINAGAVSLTLGSPLLPNINFHVSELVKLGCSGTATVEPGAVQLHCQSNSVPPALIKASAT
jgi:hypothetical protein